MGYTPAELFASTAPYYHYRPGYPPELYDLLADRFSLNSGSRVLDLGTGIGLLALPLAARAGQVLAVDPEPGMLAEGQALAEQQGLDNITWIRGDSTQVRTLNLGRTVDLVVMGAAFHWMDRDRVLVDLDTLIAPDGGVVLASGGAPGEVEPPNWQTVVDEVRTRHLGPHRKAGRVTYTHPAERHHQVLERSPFPRVETHKWDRTITRTLDEVVALQYSFSYSSPTQLGDHMSAFDADLRAALLNTAAESQPPAKHTVAGLGIPGPQGSGQGPARCLCFSPTRGCTRTGRDAGQREIHDASGSSRVLMRRSS